MELITSKKNIRIVIAVVLTISAISLLQILASKSKPQVDGQSINEIALEQDIKAEKIEVVHFHATQQCWSCIVLGEYALETLQARFPDELESGKIKFYEINIDLPENSEIVQRYKATGSSLFTNIIYEGQDHIEEEVQVWRHLDSEIQFRKYLGDKLEKYL